MFRSVAGISFVLLLSVGHSLTMQAQTGATTAGGASSDGQPVHKIAGGVTAPVILSAPDPEFSEQARRAKTGGTVLVNVVVGTDGVPTHVHVIRGVGMGLDEKAVEAVQRYRFRPATRDGQAVRVAINIEVSFQIK